MGENHFGEFPHKADGPQNAVMADEKRLHHPTQEMRRAKLVDTV